LITYFQINEDNNILNIAEYPNEDRVPSVVSGADDWYLSPYSGGDLLFKKYFPDESRFEDRSVEDIQGDI
jgi:hypothetical protein